MPLMTTTSQMQDCASTPDPKAVSTTTHKDPLEDDFNFFNIISEPIR